MAKNSPQYRAVRSNFSQLTKSIVSASVIGEFARKAFEKNLISDQQSRNAVESATTEDNRSHNLLYQILVKIESNATNFDIFVSILDDIPVLHEFADKLRTLVPKSESSSSQKETHPLTQQNCDQLLLGPKYNPNTPQVQAPISESVQANDESSSPSPSVPDTATGGDSEVQMYPQFVEKLQKEWKIIERDRLTLIENGITSDEVWAMMTLDDLNELKLTIGGGKLLKAHLPKRSFSRQLTQEEDAFDPEFLKTLLQCNVSQKNRRILQDNGITTWEVFKDLTSENLKEMGIPIGGRKLLEKLLLQLHQDTIHYSTQETTQKPTTVSDGSSPRHSAPDTATGEDLLELSAKQMCAQFMEKLQREWKIVTNDRITLIENDITSDEVWAMMTLDDIKELKLTHGGRKILEARLPKSLPPICKRSFSRELSREEDRRILQGSSPSPSAATGGVDSELSEEQLERQQQPNTFTAFSQATTGNPRSKKQQYPNFSQKTTDLPGTRVIYTLDHSELGKSERVMTGGGGYTGKNNGEKVVTPVFKAPAPVPDGWDPPETDSDGPSKQTSYLPYPRVIKDDCTMKHTPQLKLDRDPKLLTKLSTDRIQLPSSLVGNYHMKRPCKSPEKGHGLALIINNETFASPQHKQCLGTYHDEYNLVETFRFLGYRVEIRRNCSKEVIEGIFGDISHMIEEEDDSFVCCILSRGIDNLIFGSDSKGVVLRTEENSLEAKLSECIKLENKPKMFFVSTSRFFEDSAGNYKQGSHTSWEAKRTHHDSIQNPRADFAFNYATLPGEASWRCTDTGTFYINKLCQVLCQNATKATLSDIQKKVAQEVSEMEKYQMPTIEEQTTKNIYFFDDFFDEHIAEAQPEVIAEAIAEEQLDSGVQQALDAQLLQFKAQEEALKAQQEVYRFGENDITSYEISCTLTLEDLKELELKELKLTFGARKKLEQRLTKPGPCPLDTLSGSSLTVTERDHVTICGYLYKMERPQIERLGGVLGLDPYKLRHMFVLPDDMVLAWLRKEDNVAKELTWNVLVEALRRPVIGQNGIADQIFKDKCSGTPKQE